MNILNFEDFKTKYFINNNDDGDTMDEAIKLGMVESKLSEEKMRLYMDAFIHFQYSEYITQTIRESLT